MIDAYFRATLAVLKASPIVQSHNVTFEQRGRFAGYVRGDLFFADDSQPHFREFVNTQGGIDRFIYVYHYQTADGKMIFRYDNSGHFPDVATHPHHKHLADDQTVTASNAPTLADVLAEIAAL